MAKKQKKEKDLFLDTLHMAHIKIIKDMSTKILYDNGYNKLSSLSNDFKGKSYLYAVKGNVEDLIDYELFSKFIDLYMDILLIIEQRLDFSKVYKQILKKFIDNLTKCNIPPINYLIFFNKVLDSVDRDLYSKGFEIDNIQEFTSGIFMLILDTYATHAKQKNLEILSITKVGEEIKVIYSKKPLIANDLIVKYRKQLLDTGVCSNILEIYNADISSNYSTFMYQKENNFINKNNHQTESIMYFLPVEFGENKLLTDSVSEFEISNLLNHLKYVIPKNGIEIKFLNKSSHIHSIILKETDIKYSFDIYFKNNNNISYIPKFISSNNFIDLENLPKSQKTLYTKPLLKITQNLKKKVLEYEWPLNDIDLLYSNTNTTFFSELKLIKSLNRIIFSCLYVVLCDPFRFKHNFKLSNILTDDEKERKKREDLFRIAHVRKLPRGQRASVMAIAEAKKHNIKLSENETFVTEFYSNKNLDKTEKKRILTIN